MTEETTTSTDLADRLAASEDSLRRSNLLQRIGLALTSTLDLSSVLEQTMAMAADVLNAQGSALMLVDAARNELVFEVPHGEVAGVLQQMRMSIDEGFAGWVARHGESLLTNDVQNDPRHASRIDSSTGFTTRSLLCVPLQVSTRGHTSTIGVLQVVNRQDGDFTESDLEWLQILGSQAAIAIENARLYEDLRSQRDRIIKAQEEARHELARNLHDGAAQVIGALILNLDNLRRLMGSDLRKAMNEIDYLEHLARQAHQQVRQFLFELRPIILETQGLVPAMEAYVRQLHAEISFEVQLEADTIPPLAQEAGTVIFAIIQEAINNAKKHSSARHAWIRLRLSGAFLVIEVEDDGMGFDVEEVLSTYDQGSSLGLIHMRERATLLDGQLQITSRHPDEQQGTLVRLTIPLGHIITV